MPSSLIRQRLAPVVSVLLLAVFSTAPALAATKEKLARRVDTPPHLLELPATFDRLTLNEGGTLAAVYDDSSGRLEFVDLETGRSIPFQMGDYTVMSVMAVGGSDLFAVVGVDHDRLGTGFWLVDGARGVSLRDMEVPEYVATTAFATDQKQVYVSDGLQTMVLVVEFCQIQTRVPLDCEPSKERFTFSSVHIFDFLEAPANTLVIDTDSGMLIATSEFEAMIAGYDARYGKYYFYDKLPGGIPAERMSQAIGPDRMSLFVTYSGGRDIDVLDINRDFREWRSGSLGLLDVDRLAESGAPVVSIEALVGAYRPPAVGLTNDSAGRTEATAFPQRGQVRSSASQNAIFIAGPRGAGLLAMSRPSEAVELLYRIDTGGWPASDFDVSGAGNVMAILLGDRLFVAQPRDLGTRIAQPELQPPSDRGPLVVAIQTRLAALGFFTGNVIDGVWGPASAAALERFLGRGGFKGADATRPAELPSDVLGALFLGALDTLPVDAFSPEVIADIGRHAFDLYFDREFSAIRNFAPQEIYTAGADPTGGKCAGLNGLPPEALWPEIHYALVALERLRRSIDRPVRVVSTYQTPEYAACVGTPPEVAGAHEGFAAIQFLADDTPAEALPELLEKAGLADGARILPDGSTAHLWAPGASGQTENLGLWHALIAAYTPSARGCEAAKEDVEEFAALLQGSGLKGLQLYVVRKTDTDLLAVTLDAGDNQAIARKAVQLIRQAATRTADRRTGADSYMRQNDGFTLAPDCRSLAILN